MVIADEPGALATANPDSRVVRTGDGTSVELPAAPSWWPAAAGDDLALAFWRGAIAATRWMADVVKR